VPNGVLGVRSRGIIGGAGQIVPLTAVLWSPVRVPIDPPALTIFVEAISDDSVVRTRLRAIGNCTLPRLRNGWPQRNTLSPWMAVTVQAELIDTSPSTSTIPAISPGASFASSGRGAVVPPCAVPKPRLPS